MGLFDFFKKKGQPEKKSDEIPQGNYTKEQVQEETLFCLNILCDDVSDLKDVKKHLRAKGHDENAVIILSERALELYTKHFLKDKPDRFKLLFGNIYKYREYISMFTNMQREGNYAPISAYENAEGSLLTGFLYTIGNSPYHYSPTQAVENLENTLRNRKIEKNINSYVVLYHSRYDYNDDHSVALKEGELKAVSIIYNFGNGIAGKMALPYLNDGPEITHKGFDEFTAEQNRSIFDNNNILPGKEYFQEMVDAVAPVIEKPNGIKITKSNTLDLVNTWSGIFGFESYNQPDGSQALEDCLNAAIETKPALINDIEVRYTDFKDVRFKTVSRGRQITIFPVINTNYTIDMETREINEWENMGGLEAIITAKGKDTFGFSFFATDYAENNALYQEQVKHIINVSGIAFVLDVFKKEGLDTDIRFSDDFTMYMPNNQLRHLACFDFVGELEEFRETTLLSDSSLKAYIMKVRLITHEIKDFFTIDMYVTPENMRFTELVKGMKLTGMFQMLGQIHS